MFTVLVVDDDINTRKMFDAVLRRDGYTVLTAADGRLAMEVMEKNYIDLILLDVSMPVMDGYTFCRELRSVGNYVPIIMVSARKLPSEIKEGLAAGADDYMVKPVDMEELLLRVKALFRRAQCVSGKLLRVGGTELDYSRLSVTSGKVSLTLPPKEFLLLYMLLSHPGRVFTRIQLMDEIWGLDSESCDITINTHIARLRRRLSSITDFKLLAVRGVGYKAVVTV